MSDNKIECPRGDTRIITATILDADGLALDLTNLDKVYLSIKENKEDSVYVVKKKEGTVEGAAALGVVAFEIEPADLEEVATGNWWYDIELNFVDGSRYTPIIDNFEVLADITRLTYAITASTGANGAISPTGAVSVESGADQAFIMTPADGYEIDEVKIDDVATTDYVTDDDGVGAYTFSTVGSDYTIAVAYKLTA